MLSMHSRRPNRIGLSCLSLILLLSLLLSACGGGGTGTMNYTIGGTITGLSASGLTLTDNGGATLAVASGATTFTFATPLAAGSQYEVAVSSQPTRQSCSVSSATGTVSGNVTTVSVACVNVYAIGGTVRGLMSGAQLTLLDNGADPLILAANGSFTFSTLIADGKGYVVTVGTQPSGQFCEVTDGSGTVSGDVTNVQAACLALLYSFSFGTDSANPAGGLIMDSSGNFYGTAQYGGLSNFGTVFKLEPTGGGSYAESVLYSFAGGSDGAYPDGPLIMDSSGNLYGTTRAGGGSSNFGTVFKLVPNGSGGYTESVLHAFTGSSDGQDPVGPLLMDSGGDLYGTTEFGGGANDYGTVFRLAPGGGGYTESVLYGFAGVNDGANPVSGLIMDKAGNLYGTTAYGGSGSSLAYYSYGTVFELASNGSGGYTESVLYRFTGGSDGANPFTGLVVDSAGNFYGTTVNGGGSQNDGSVFKLAPNGGGGYAESVLHSFGGGGDGVNPSSGLIMDNAGNLYGTTSFGGGSNNSGIVFMLSPNTSGGYAESILYSFTAGSDGSLPSGGLIMDSAGDIYGTAGYSGNGGSGYGTAFEIYAH